MQEQNTTKVIFSARLRQSMVSQKVTQVELADACGVAQSAVFKWLNGSIPSADLLHKAARCLKTTMEDLLGVVPLDRSEKGLVREAPAEYHARSKAVAKEMREIIRDLEAVRGRAVAVLEKLE